MVSDAGRVRSIDRIDTMGRPWRGIVLSPSVRRGYPRVTLCRDGERDPRYVHRLVAEAFIGPCPDGMECCHIDGNSQNNSRSNLRWGTPTSNNADKIKHGTLLFGAKSPVSKLCELDVWLIRNCESRVTDLASFFGVSVSTIYRAKNRECWTHVA